MNQYVTGAVIKELREKKKLTQAELAEKQHYISFIAAVSSDRLQIVKLYPEGDAEARFKISGLRQLFFYCNKDGLFKVDLKIRA